MAAGGDALLLQRRRACANCAAPATKTWIRALLSSLPVLMAGHKQISAERLHLGGADVLHDG